MEELFVGNSVILLFWVYISFIIDIDEYYKKIILMYLITYIANVLNIVPTFQSYEILLLALFLDIEFLHDKFKKIIINSFPEKLLDFLYIMITHYSLIFFSAALFLSSDWILNCFVNTVKIILMIISCIFIYLGCKNSASEKFKIASFDEIKEKIDNIEKYRPFSEREDEICAPECVLFIEDKNFFNRGNRYTFFNRFYLQDSYRRKLKKLFFRFLRSENKTNCIDKALRGYSTIEMQFLRTLSIKNGYNYVFRRKAYEIIYSRLFLRNLKIYYKKCNCDIRCFKDYILYLYLRCAPCLNKGQEERVNSVLGYRKKIEIYSKEKLFALTLCFSGKIEWPIMLRPTESPIVFIQQLGRGLRKAEGKEYVVVLDFIGNYRNNFMIPIALSGDRSYNKDNIRRYITEGGRVIPGASTIHFDEISRKRIFQAIDNANFSDIKLIRENYTNLKNKLGHIPALADFDKYGEMDVLRIFDNNSLGSYYKFLVKYEKEYKIRLSANEEKVIEFVSKKLASGKRIHELELLKRSLKYHHGLLGLLQESLSENYQQSMDENCAENIINMMTNHFPTNAAQKTYANCVFLEKEEDDYAVSKTFEAMLQNPDFYHILEELVDFGISRYHANYCNRYQNTDLVLYQKYTYEDVCRLLNWERNEVPLNIGGYKFDKKTKTFPIFINYDKQDDISDTTKYEDHFVGDNRLIAISKSGRTIASEDVQNFLHAKERGIDVQLFVRKNKDDKISKEFYYLGRVNATGQVKEFVMPNTDKTAVEIEWVLDTPVREDIYEYIVNG